jgi:ATP:ADP antiporter, AAA family
VVEARSATQGTVRSAMLCAFAMVAQQVAAKAARDALFLSTFPVSALATMITVAAAASAVFAIGSARLLSRRGPFRAVPAAFLAGAALHLAVWASMARAPRAAAVALYLHTVTLGAVLVSGFWSIVSERFDPRTAKRWIARIAGAGTLGGLAGGLAAERLAALMGLAEVMPLLAALEVACALSVRRMAPETEETRARAVPADGGGLRAVAADRYLRGLAALVITVSMAATLVDVAFKTRVVATVGSGPALLRLFALLYTASALVAFAVQLLFGRASLEHLGLARTVSLLPATVAAGALAGLALPGVWTLGLLRGADAVVRTSLYRLGYELLYTPVSPARKRATKTVIDVGLDRVGEALGAGVLRVALAGMAAPVPFLLGVVAALGGLGLWLARSLHHGYVRALEQSLLARAVSLDPSEVVDGTTRRTMAALGVVATGGVTPVALPVPAAAEGLDTGLLLLTLTRERPAVSHSTPGAATSDPVVPALPVAARVPDAVVARLAELRSGDGSRVVRALRAGPLEASLVPEAIRLLAWDAVAAAAAETLRPVAARAVGQLVDALLDPDEEFAVRRRVTPLLASVSDARATDGLLRGLADPRFEVRYECGRALAHRPSASLPPGTTEAVLEAVLRETAVPRELWASRTLLDAGPAARAPGQTSLEHVFTLLSLVSPSRSLKAALLALSGRDERLRGTALEYLHLVLPPPVRTALWPLLDQTEAPRVKRSPEELERELQRLRTEAGAPS